MSLVKLILMARHEQKAVNTSSAGGLIQTDDDLCDIHPLVLR